MFILLYWIEHLPKLVGIWILCMVHVIIDILFSSFSAIVSIVSQIKENVHDLFREKKSKNFSFDEGTLVVKRRTNYMTIAFWRN